MKKSKFFIIPTFLIAFAILIFPVMGNALETKSIKAIAILPFETNAQEDISYITSGILSMLHSRLTWKDNVQIVNKNKTLKLLSSLQQQPEKPTLKQFGEKANADYVITGIVTRFSGAFSVDTKVYDIKKGTFLSFFDQSKTLDGIISKVDIVAAKINKKVFDRTTVSYEKFKKDKIITEEELKRMNPERMMPRQQITEEDKPWWKIW